MLPDATRLSQPAASGQGPRRRSAARSGHESSLARRWLELSLCVLCFPSCLITSTPEFDEPTQTAPFLLPSSVDPDNRQVLRIEGDNPLQFSAQVLSEDAGARVQVSLLIDYGVRDELSGRVFQDNDPNNAALNASTLADGPRRVSANFFPKRLAPGCHTVTLMVSHEFDFASGCPVRKADSSQLVWFVFKCEDANCQNADSVLDCPVADPAVSCPDQVGGAPASTP